MSSVDELVAWLRAQFDEDERVAKAAEDGPWHVDHEHYAEAIYSAGGVSVVAGGRWGDEASVFNDTADAIHIALHDPARVLREVEAKRAILAGHPFEQGTVGGCCGTCHGAGRIEVYWDGEEETVEHVDTEMVWPCPTVRNLTAAYIDREGFREEWRPWRP